MGIRSSDSIYQTVEKLLAKATKPMTCADLMDIPEMRDAAMKRFKADQQIATNKLSDTLGFMWRKGVIARYPAPSESSSMARFAYGVKEKKEAEVKPLPPPARLSAKPVFHIEESADSVTFDFEHFTLIVKKK